VGIFSDNISRRFVKMTCGGGDVRRGSTIQYGMTEDTDKPWSMQQTRKSPAYTTNWSELPVVKAAVSMPKKKKRSTGSNI